MPVERAYPKLRFAHVVMAMFAACLFIAISWYLLRYLPARAALNRAERVHDLYSLGQAYHTFQLRYDTSPASREDLKPLLMEHPGAWSRLQQEEYVVVWQAKMKQNESMANAILAHEVLQYDGNILVLFGDGHVDVVEWVASRSIPFVQSE